MAPQRSRTVAASGGASASARFSPHSPVPTLLVTFALLALGPGALRAGSLITVTTTADSGAGSLREAIETANGDAGPTTITFAGGLAGSTIALQSQLPSLTEGGDTIDGDLGDDCDPDIGLDGSAAGGGADGLALLSDGNALRGLAFFDFDGDGLHVEGSDNVVECNYFGTNLALASGHGNAGRGIRTVGGSEDNRFGPGNVIAHNGETGISVVEEVVAGAYPGFGSLVADAVEVFPVLDFTTGPDESFQSTDAIRPVDGGGAPFIDTFGVRLSGTLTAGTAGNYTLTLAADNQARVLIDDVEVASADHEEVQAEVALDGGHSIEVDHLEGCGGASLTVTFAGPGELSFSTDGAIGGACAGGQMGLCGELFHLRMTSERNQITENAIFGNGELGIDLAQCGGPSPNPNDPGDVDLGPNTILNHPEITGIGYAGTPGSYTVSGTAPASSTVELFLSDGDPSGFGEGETYLASFVATGGGTFSGSAAFDPGDLLTATATDPAGNSSEFGPNFLAGEGVADEATVGSTSALPGATFEIPISVRDRSLTALGMDRPAGERIQSLAFKVILSAPASIAAKSAARAGITATLTPAFQSTPSTASSISYIGQFDEGTDPIPFALDAGAPGDQVAKLTITLTGDAPAGTIALTLDAGATALGNFAGTIEETEANGRLALASGAITVLSHAAQNLYATATSSTTVDLLWGDPNQNETGFRIERSTDGASWSTVTTVGPNVTSYTDTGRSPATLYYYRIRTLTPADAQLSQRAFATTWPSTAAKVCVERLPGTDATWADFPSPAWNNVDEEWGVAWEAREDGLQDDIWFQRRDGATLAPIGPPVNVSQSDTSSFLPSLAWNGSHYLVSWFEGLQREPGILSNELHRFALLEPDGTIVRRGVAPASTSLGLGAIFPRPLPWDGTHWGYLTSEVPTTRPFTDLFYRRLEEDADVVLGPAAITTTGGFAEETAELKFNPDLGQHGAAWTRELDDTAELFFERIEESTGAALGSPQSLAPPYAREYFGTYGISTVANGADGWAVAWTEVDGGDYATYLRKVDPTGTPVGGGKVRLSDPAPALDFVPRLLNRPDGGFVVFTNGYSYSTYSYEILRAQAASSGAKDGPVVVVSPEDGLHSYYPAVASDGSRFLVVWNESDPAGGQGLEVSGLLVDADGLSAPGPKVDLTSGHTPGPGFVFLTPVPVEALPLGAGFVALWTGPAHPAEIRARSWDGAGAVVQDFLPLNTAPLAGSVAAVSVGDTFAVFWRTGPNDYRFARYDANGALTGESGIGSAGDGGVSLGFDGESYVALVRAGPDLLFRKIDPDGNPVGLEITVPAIGVTNPKMLWTGAGWALLWRGPAPARELYFALLDRDGAVITAPTVVGAVSRGAVSDFSFAWSGTELGVAWAQRKNEFYPPHGEIYFTRLGLDGSKAFPETTVVSSPVQDRLARLYWADGAFRLIHSAGGVSLGPGLREIAIDPADGSVLPGERYWTNRGSGGAHAWNGITLGTLWGPARVLHFQTGACVDDPSPPPCPSLSVASVGGVPRLSWPAVSDPESTIWRYQVLRDGTHLAELASDKLAFDDAGYETATTHAYLVLAMNGAYNESDGCTPVPFSTTAGDANGSGTFDIADLFYEINWFYGDGDPPAGDGDANGDGGVTPGDLFYLINHFFSGGPPPV
jgi:hypothetical protein